MKSSGYPTTFAIAGPRRLRPANDRNTEVYSMNWRTVPGRLLPVGPLESCRFVRFNRVDFAGTRENA